MGTRRLDWDKVGRERRDRRHARNEVLPVLGGRSHRCWCGDTIGHEWYGKYAGLPHPPEEEK